MWWRAGGHFVEECALEGSAGGRRQATGDSRRDGGGRLLGGSGDSALERRTGTLLLSPAGYSSAERAQSERKQ